MRAELNARARRFFDTRGALEVETPILEAHATNDAGVNNFPEIQFSAAQGECLRTSPEYSMKRLIAACHEDVYQIGKVFRDDFESATHRREFTLLEWYRLDWDYRRLMRETAELLKVLLAPRGKFEPLYVRHAELIESVGLNTNASTAELIAWCEKGGFKTCRYRDEAWDYIMTVVARDFDSSRLTFVHDYPPELAQLAQLSNRDGERFAERFEAYVGAIELVNGCSELRDLAECRRRCEEQNRRRARNEQPAVEPFLLYDALRRGLPICAGAAMGLDRVLMCLMDAETIADIESPGLRVKPPR